MDKRAFDDVARAIGRGTSRRGVLGAVAALVAAAPQSSRAGRRDAPGASKKKKKCTAAKCPTGCCSGKTCLPGTSVDACGTGGAACAACAAGKACFGGTCTSCTPATCTGCCAGETCAPGNVVSACGVGAAACAVCDGPTPCCTGGTCAGRAWQPQTTFGSGPGAGASQFETPFGIALSGDLLTAFVSDIGNDRVSIWTRPNPRSIAWSNQTTFGTKGLAAGQLQSPAGVAAAPDGQTVWVADSVNSRISIWTKTGPGGSWVNPTTFGQQGSGPSQLMMPYGVAVTPDGLTAAVADTFNHRVSVWTRPAGSLLWSNQAIFGSEGSAPDQFAAPAGPAISADGLQLLVADTSNFRISVWTRSGAGSADWTHQANFGSFGSGVDQFLVPTDVALSPDLRTAWIADQQNSRVSVWTRSGAASTDWTPQQTFGTPGAGASSFDKPTSVAVSDTGNVAWVADQSNHRVSAWAGVCA